MTFVPRSKLVMLALAMLAMTATANAQVNPSDRAAPPRQPPTTTQSQPVPQGTQPTTTTTTTGVSQGTPSVLIDDQRGAEVTEDTTLREDQIAGTRPPPFGSELFTGASVPASAGTVDPSYVVRTGDQISVTTYGLINEASVQTVDAEGNISLPNIGPVRVGGTPASNVNAAVSNAASQVYQDTVQVYATVLGAGQIQIFVAGPVERPGAVTGTSVDSVVTMLQRAGGIDPDRGSYRNIIVRRRGEIIGEVDLYDFLLNGDLSGIELRNGDVIVVGQQGPIVSVSGDARAPFTFEFSTAAALGEELLRYARPRPEVTHVSVLGTREGEPYNDYVRRADFAGVSLFDGDRVRFEADARADTLVVRVVGAHDGPSSYIVPRGESLGAVIARIPLSPLADTPMIHLERQSVAEAQKQLLEDNLARLERVLFTNPAPTAEIAATQAAQAEGILTFIDRARQVEPRGLVSLPEEADLYSVILEPDDIIVVPYISQTVVIAGEVEVPQTVLWTPGDARDYVAQAGGFTRLANRSDTLVVHPDGSTARGGDVRAGDRILVPPKAAGQLISVISDITQIIAQLGISYAAVSNP